MGPPGDLSMSTPTWAYRPKPLLHGLNFSKSPIKTHAALFGSGRVVKLDQTNPTLHHILIPQTTNKVY